MKERHPKRQKTTKKIIHHFGIFIKSTKDHLLSLMLKYTILIPIDTPTGLLALINMEWVFLEIHIIHLIRYWVVVATLNIRSLRTMLILATIQNITLIH